MAGACLFGAITRLAAKTNQLSSLKEDQGHFATSAKLKSKKAQTARLFHPYQHLPQRSFEQFQAKPNQSTMDWQTRGSSRGAFDAGNDSIKEWKKLNQSLGPQKLLANSTHFKQPSLSTQCPMSERIIDH